MIDMEGLNFVTERVYKGANFNLLTQLTGMKSHFTIRTTESTHIYFLTTEQLKELRENNDEIDKALSAYEFTKIRQENLHPLNISHYLEIFDEELREQISRETKLKNITYSIMIRNSIKKHSQ